MGWSWQGCSIEVRCTVGCLVLNKTATICRTFHGFACVTIHVFVYSEFPKMPVNSSLASVSKPAPSFKLRMLRLHRALAYFGFAALLLWGCSGLLHSWITMFGVQQAVFSAPKRALNISEALPFEQILKMAGLRKAVAVKVVVGESDNLLQVTEHANQPRRYFDLKTGAELQGYDSVYAAYLARHYLNLHDSSIAKVEWVDQFSSQYPSVNRLLPVYRVQFDRDDGLNAFIYTETGVLASVSNHTKQRVQTAFQWFHSWSWVPRFAETLRIGLIGVLVGALLLMSLSGLAMLILIRRKVRAKGAKGLHRGAAYFLVLPVLMFSFSGVFHLLQHGWPEDTSHLTMRKPMNLEQLKFPIHAEWKKLTEQLLITSFSIVVNQANEPFYRLALPLQKGNVPTEEKAIRNARFDGVQHTGPALYINARHGTPWPEGDLEMAHQLAEQYTGLPRNTVKNVGLVTRFGSDYDFRNKRLPVWKFSYDAPFNASVFIDTATGTLVDRTNDSAKPELWVFSMFHKWSFLGPLGREIQNMTMAIVVFLSIVLMACLGLKSRFSK